MNPDSSSEQSSPHRNARPSSRMAGGRSAGTKEGGGRAGKSLTAQLMQSQGEEKSSSKFGFASLLGKHSSSHGSSGKEKSSSLTTSIMGSPSVGGGGALSSQEIQSEATPTATAAAGADAEKEEKKKEEGGDPPSSIVPLTRSRSVGRLRTGQTTGTEEWGNTTMPVGVGGRGSSPSPTFIGAAAGAGAPGGKAAFGRRAQSATPAESKRLGRSLFRKGDVEERTAEEVPFLDEGDGTAGGGGPNGAMKERQRQIQEERERLGKQVAKLPTGFQAELPCFNNLSSNYQWERLLQHIHKEFDMSCLTTCLSSELDEDLPWNPDMLLVQLTSSLRDAAESRVGVAGGDGMGGGFGVEDGGEGGASGDGPTIRLGLLAGGEVLRKRKERVVVGDTDPHYANLAEEGGEVEEDRAAGKSKPASTSTGGGGGHLAHASPAVEKPKLPPSGVGSPPSKATVAAVQLPEKSSDAFAPKSGRGDAGSPSSRSAAEARRKLKEKQMKAGNKEGDEAKK